MTVTTPDLTALSQGLSEACLTISVAQGPAGIANVLSRLAPGISFRTVLTRGGWYRLGGVVDAQGRHVTDDLESWVCDLVARYDNDLSAMIADQARAQMYATRWVGKTHYWVGRLGTQPEEFLQIEIEELQETISHRLFPCEGMPSSIEEFIDRRETAAGSRQVLGAAFYRLRRITDVAAFLEAMRRQKPEPQPIHRFFSDWARSSANLACEFENHWVLSLREHLDRYHQTVKSATPVAAINGAKPSFAAPHVHGLPLAHAIARYDRQVGYPMAWFFHMLTIHTVPHTVAIAVIEDMDDGFGYLPDRDLEIVRDWLRRCYGF